MKFAISGTDLKQVDKYTIDIIGIPSLVLMERAALTVAEEIISFATLEDRIVAVCGTGNNGADGIAVARILRNKGYDTCVYIVGNQEKGTDEFNLQKDIYIKTGGSVVQYSDEYASGAFSGNIVVDAIFGVGLSREVNGDFKLAIEGINSFADKVISVDVPSGIQADNGQVMGIAVKADITVTFGMNKTGIVMYPGADYAGKIIVSDIGFPDFVFDKFTLYKIIESSDFGMIPKRSNESNKGTYGKVLIIAGSDSMSGAALMCAKSALRMGAGMVKVFTTESTATVLKNTLPEVMVTAYTDNDYKEQLSKDLDWCDVVAVGPGLGVGPLQGEIIKMVLQSELPTVVDADGINVISRDDNLKKLFHKKIIITPHIGEMSRFTDMSISDIKERAFDVARNVANGYGITVVLKDARTVISDGDNIYINTSGNNGMSTAGSGDVLTGIVASLLAKGMEPIMAGSLAAYVHGLAGDMAADRLSRTALVATDIIDEIIKITKAFE